MYLDIHEMIGTLSWGKDCLLESSMHTIIHFECDAVCKINKYMYTYSSWDNGLYSAGSSL